MVSSSLANSPIGRLTPVRAPDPATGEATSGEAFLPDPLPREVVLSTATWTAVNEATAALARLDGAARLIPNPGLLRRPALRREAQSTSALEGTFAPFSEVLAADAERQEISAAMREILNFERTAELAFSWPEDRPLTIAMLSALQRTLVRGTSGELRDAGRIRERLVLIGAPGSRLGEARFVPPPPGDQLKAGVEALLGWIEDPPTVPTVVQAAMAHYQFETLHPYSDGNGRLGRLLVIVQLLRGAVIREPLLVVSPWFEARRERYQDALLALSCDGDWDAWVGFFAAGVAASAVESRVKVERLVALQAELRERVQRAGKRGVAEQIAADLVGNPYPSVPLVRSTYRLSKQGAHNAIRALVEIGVIEPWEGVTLNRAQMYRAPEVMRVLEA
ncbi:Fic family protein [Conexibacter arvalis]|uniref:Fic family protein n=1 Tax=Conexibacter arvalis TaxID=912552 RepID=A0A840II68_9ACTN|nr:Fic/DOC family N-terminal domain-containing protein [Conexibacter arvalis]MBB4664672.1 Fic family protein [Conexibacter arvalis]